MLRCCEFRLFREGLNFASLSNQPINRLNSRALTDTASLTHTRSLSFSVPLSDSLSLFLCFAYLYTPEFVALESVRATGAFGVDEEREPGLHAAVPRDSGKAALRVGSTGAASQSLRRRRRGTRRRRLAEGKCSACIHHWCSTRSRRSPAIKYTKQLKPTQTRSPLCCLPTEAERASPTARPPLQAV